MANHYNFDTMNTPNQKGVHFRCRGVHFPQKGVQLFAKGVQLFKAT